MYYICLILLHLCKSTTVLVTGGTGYIGSHTTVALQKAGYSVIIVDDLSNSKRLVLNSIYMLTGIKPQFYQIDCTDYETFKAVFKDNHIDAVIHMAGFKAVGESIEKPIIYYENNLVSTLTLLRLMQEYDVSKLVFSSSATVYGSSPLQDGYSEDMPTGCGITNPYGRTKYMIEELLKDFCHAHSRLSVTILRYFNPIGAHPSGLLGENPNGIPNNLLPVIMKVYQHKTDKLHVYGNDYPTPDGTCIRDYIHVEDLARGHVAALEHSVVGISIFNLGTGSGSSVRQIIELFQELSNSTLPWDYVPRRAGDLAIVYANVEKALLQLQWKARYTIREAIRDTLNFLSHQGEISI